MEDGDTQKSNAELALLESLEIEEEDFEDNGILWPLPIWWDNPEYQLVRIEKEEGLL